MSVGGTEGKAFEIPVTGELDLHAFAPREIVSAACEYLLACRERGISRVRLIHGRGRGVQRALVRRALRAMPEVAAIADASAEAGGWGVTVVDLAPRRHPAEPG